MSGFKRSAPPNPLTAENASARIGTIDSATVKVSADARSRSLLLMNASTAWFRMCQTRSAVVCRETLVSRSNVFCSSQLGACRATSVTGLRRRCFALHKSIVRARLAGSQVCRRSARCAHMDFTISSSFMARLVANGKYLRDGAQKFYIRGVSYGPFAPNSSGERYPEPERAAADFALMNKLGANVIRLYVPPPPWMVEEAQKAGLRMMLGIPWPFHMAFLDSADMMREIRDAIRKTVLETRQFGETIAAYSIGNEIRSDIVRWHGPRAVSSFLAELRDLGKQIDPGALFTYSNYPSAEYLDLSFLDFISFNVYLHREEDFRRYLTHLMGQAGERPLVLSETGMDTIREGEEHQVEPLPWQ